MKKPNKRSQRKTNTSRILFFFLLVILFVVTVIVLPTTQTKKLSYGASSTPVPARPNLQLVLYNPSLTPTAPPQQQPGNSVQQTPTKPIQQTQPKPTQPGGFFLPITKTTPDFAALRATPIPGVGPTAPKSNGQLCSGTDNSGKTVSGSCYCPALTVTCKNGVGYGANGGLYPGPNPCGSSAAPGSGRYCVEKPVIYLYPTVPTLVDVQVITSGSVVVSDPAYPIGGWKNVLAYPDGTLSYNGKDYSELFYESSVNNFTQPRQGVTIPANQLSETLGKLLDKLGLVGNEKQEFLSFWLPKLQALHSPYVFFSVLTPTAKASIDAVNITPKPDTQIAFIAYFKPLLQTQKDTLNLPQAQKRQGFVSVEWGGVIDTH